MMRTQIYLPKQLYQRIADVARKGRKPKAQVIRDLLEQGLDRERHDRAVSAGEALQRLVQISARGPRDLSRDIDRYLYTDP